MAKESLSPSEDYWNQFRPKTSIGKSLFFRYENDGIIVYDSSARIFDEPASNVTPQLEPEKPRKKIDVMDADDYGNCQLDISQYINMKNYQKYRVYPQDFTLVVPEDCLRFNSKFESGNLKKAIKLNDSEYNLFLDYDTETLGYTQWFYFSIKNQKITSSIRFNIMNFVKCDSLYNKGMKPLVYSLKQSSKGWTRDCSAVAYYKNGIQRLNNRTFYTLTFTYYFKDIDDQVYFAYNYPYTYSNLLTELENIKTEEYRNYVRVDTMCQTLAGNGVPIITVTKNIKSYTPWDQELEKLKKSAAGRKNLRSKALKDKEKFKESEVKRCIVITARVHPGETNGSYMMRGFLGFIIGKTKEAKLLRKSFVFKIIPMLNPDGVIYGNYRCSLLGVDLNRRWKKPNKILHPEIYYLKRLIQMLSEEKEISLFCDFHGHSIKKDVFIYGCKDLQNPRQDMLIKILPFLLSKKNKNFSFKKSIFRVGKDKTSTGRAVCFQDLKILNSYTMEASFFGPSCKSFFENKDPEPDDINFDKHFEIFHYEKIGKDFGKIIVAVTSPKEFNKLLKILCDEKVEKVKSENFQGIIEYEEVDQNPRSRFASFSNYIGESVIDEMCLSDENESNDCSDSEGSDNDDKKIKYKQEKIKLHKVKVKNQKSLEIEKVDKMLRNTVSNYKKHVERPKADAYRNLASASRKRSKEFEIGKISNTSPDTYSRYSRNKEPVTFKTSLKHAVAVMLPKESLLFKSKETHSNYSQPDRKNRKERYNKPEVHPAKIKFKEVTMFVEDKKKFNNFKYII